MSYPQISLRFKQLNKNAVLPSRETPVSAGLDIFSIEDVLIEPRGRSIIYSGFAVAIPEGFYGRLAPRSSLAANNGLDILAGVIDADYREEVICILYNTGDELIKLPRGSKICQLIIEKVITPDPVWVESLDKTSRGSKEHGPTKA